MRIAIVAHRGTVNAHYRAAPLTHLTSRGHHIRAELDGVKLEPLAASDVVHVYRFSDRGTREILREVRRRGVGIVWDNDDDLTAGVERRRGALRSQRLKSEIQEMVRLAHVVTTPSPVLAEQYREWGAREVLVIDNFLPDWFPRQGRARHGDELVIGWLASKEHQDDLAALGITRVLEQVLDRHPHVRVESIGIHLGLSGDRYDQTMHVKFEELPDRLVGWDIGIAPLADTQFNRSRSSVKLKEYAATGIPWLASPVGPYIGLGKKQGGRLVGDDSWGAELDDLIASGRARRKLADRGAKWAQEELAGRERNVRQWETALERARAAAAMAAPR